MRCRDCVGTGHIRGHCNECGESLRPGIDAGQVCEDCERDLCSGRLDTRPAERRERARVRWLDLCSLVQFELWHARRHEHARLDRANRLLAESDRAWAWYRSWDEACHR